jgi:hypothetical protein
MFQKEVVKKIEAHRTSRHLPGLSCSDDVVKLFFSLDSPGLGYSDDEVTNTFQFNSNLPGPRCNDNVVTSISQFRKEVRETPQNRKFSISFHSICTDEFIFKWLVIWQKRRKTDKW